jgi:UDP-N-acetylglucosamine--N-acetylmuramyl-(pentapeptide) pyrophosphoryl-undecaprenol N-acetylglucosamine transferase
MIQKPILVMAGGTGGHVFPALAVAENLRQKGESVVWLGTRSGIEARVVPAADFAIEWLSVQGLRGKGLATLMLAPFRLLRACWQALRVLRRTRPKAVLGMGGFVSGYQAQGGARHGRFCLRSRRPDGLVAGHPPVPA